MKKKKNSVQKGDNDCCQHLHLFSQYFKNLLPIPCLTVGKINPDFKQFLKERILNIVGKGENNGNYHFLPFPHVFFLLLTKCFQCFHKQISILSHFKCVVHKCFESGHVHIVDMLKGVYYTLPNWKSLQTISKLMKMVENSPKG